MVTKRIAKNADKDRKIFTPNQKISYASVPSCINRNDSSLTNHDLRKRLFKKKCCYCGMPLDESEKSYPVNPHWQNQMENLGKMTITCTALFATTFD